MERRLLIAFMLSFLILVVWGKVNPPPKVPQKAVQAEYTQISENKEVIEESTSASPLSNTIADIDKQPTAFEAITIIENDKLKVEVSNRGAVIKSVFIKDYEVTLPVTDIDSIKAFSGKDFTLKESSGNALVFEYLEENVQTIKEYRLEEGTYLIHSKTSINGMSELSKQNGINVQSYRLDINRLDKKTEKSRDRGLLEYSVALPEKVFRKGNAYKISAKDAKTDSTSIKWLGFRDRYFCLIYKPQYETAGYQIEQVDNKQLRFLTKTKEITGNSLVLTAKIYFGPQDLGVLTKHNSDFQKIMRFSGLGIINFVAMTMYKVLEMLHKYISNWGVCIILTALLVYGAMYPLSIKGLMSMRRMQALQPEINKIREQYKNNPQKQQKETMELYKEHKINPIGGCLPLLMQMPFFLGVYQVLWRSVSFKGAKFLWIQDLSQPDHLLKLPTTLPFFGEYLNILPLLMIVIMFFQQRFSSKNMVAADSAQQSSQKMMMYMFPMMIGLIFYNIASGLALYFTIFYLLSTLTQWKMSKLKKAV